MDWQGTLVSYVAVATLVLTALAYIIDLASLKSPHVLLCGRARLISIILLRFSRFAA